MICGALLMAPAIFTEVPRAVRRRGNRSRRRGPPSPLEPAFALARAAFVVLFLPGVVFISVGVALALLGP